MLLANISATPPAAGSAAKTPEKAVVFETGDLLELNRVPIKKEKATVPDVDARAAMVIDVGSGLILYEKNAQERLPMASLTKIMTAVLILESHKLNEVVTIDENYGSIPGVKIWLEKSEKITVGDLLIGLLVPSGGDAALALAKYHSGSVEKFVEEMNQKATLLSLSNTHFKNPIGLDEEGHYASAVDLGMLSRYAMRKTPFRDIVRMPDAEIFSVDRAFRHAFENTNKLLGTALNILGIKTGTTDAAGASIINLARDPHGNEVIAIVLDSPNRFGENRYLLNWAFENFTW